MRYDSPVQMVMRFCTRDTHIGETSVPGGTVVRVLIGAVNRDPAQFHAPDSFDIARAIGIITLLLAMEFTPVSVPTWLGCRAESFLARSSSASHGLDSPRRTSRFTTVDISCRED